MIIISIEYYCINWKKINNKFKVEERKFLEKLIVSSKKYSPCRAPRAKAPPAARHSDRGTIYRSPRREPPLVSYSYLLTNKRFSININYSILSNFYFCVRNVESKDEAVKDKIEDAVKQNMGQLLKDERVVQEYKARKKKHPCWAILPCIAFTWFLIAYTLMVLGQNFSGYRIAQVSLENRFENGLIGNGTSVHDVRDVLTFWQYVNQTLLPTVYAKENHDRIKSIIAAGDWQEPVYSNSAIQVKLASGPTFSDGDAGENPNVDYLLGPITFRTARIRDSETCALPGETGGEFESFVPLIAKQVTQSPTGRCFGTWSSASEETRTYGSSVEPFKFWDGNEEEYWQGKEGEYWNGIISYDAWQLFGNPSSIGGELATYPSSGYVMKVDRNQTLTNRTIGHMYNNRYVDVATRMIAIEFVVWNGHSSDPRELAEGQFIFTRVMFEISPTGQWLKKNLANKIVGYLARCEFLAKLGLRFWILVG